MIGVSSPSARVDHRDTGAPSQRSEEDAVRFRRRPPKRSGYFPRDVFFFGFGFAAPLPVSAACCFFFLAGISTSRWKALLPHVDSRAATKLDSPASPG